VRAERAGGAYGLDDVVNCLAGGGGVGFVVDERFVRGRVGDTVSTVGRQRGQVVLRRLPFRVVAGIGGEPGLGAVESSNTMPAT
jgi:hypothetical protein